MMLIKRNCCNCPENTQGNKAIDSLVNKSHLAYAIAMDLCSCPAFGEDNVKQEGHSNSIVMLYNREYIHCL